MKTQEILSIIALSLLGLCFLCGLAKMAMKKDSDKKNCDKACSMAIFAAVALVGVSQLLTETEKYGDGRCYCTPQDNRVCGKSCSRNSDCTDPIGYCMQPNEQGSCDWDQGAQTCGS